MATTSSRKRVRYTFDIYFLDQVEKEAFQQRLKNIRELLTPAGRPPLDNLSLINTLLKDTPSLMTSHPCY